jgi:hypothetical protein
MHSSFKSQDLGDGYTIQEPPAGLLPYINKRIKLYSDSSSGDVLTQSTWAAIFLLACLHKESVPVIVWTASEIVTETSVHSIREAYSKVSDENFKLLVEEFLFCISKDKLKEWFEIVDTNCYITKKTEDAEKNG